MNDNVNNVAMLFVSCDSYSDTWVPFFKCLKKCWPEFSMPIYVCAESKSFSTADYDINCPLKDTTGNEQWGKRLLKTLKSIKEDYILFTLEDFWLLQKVDDNKVKNIIRIMKDDSSIGYICMINEKKPKSEEWGIPDPWVKECEYSPLWECTPKCQWRLTTQMGLWRKSYLKKMLRAHESAWAFEPLATWRSLKYSKKRVFDTKETIFDYPYGGVLWRGRVCEKYVGMYDLDLIASCIEKRGILRDIDPIPNPQVETKKDIRYYLNVLKSYLPKL